MTDLCPTRPRRAAFAVAVVLAVATFAIIALLPRSWVVYATPDRHDFASVTVLRPEALEAITLAGFGWFVVLVTLAVHGMRRRTYARACVAAVAALLGPVAPVVSFIRDPAPWQVHGEARAADGTTYCFAESSFLQGQMLILARVQEEATFSRRLDPLVVTYGDSPRSYLLVVRPAGTTDDYGQVHLTEGGWVLGLRGANRCFFAYDRSAGLGYGHGAVERLPPFLPLSDVDEPHEPDVATVVAAVTEGRQGAPTPEAVRGGLNHPNPLVRAIASRILGAAP